MNNNEQIPADENEVRHIDIPGSSIAFQSIGAGKPLILCTGYATNMDMWSEPMLRLLKERFRIITFDYRGMGLSTGASDMITIGSLAGDLRQMMNVLNIGKAHSLGWSMGGFVAQIFAVMYPEMVDRFVLYASNCGGEEAIPPDQETIDILENPTSAPMDLLGTLFPGDWMAAHPRPWEAMPQGSEPINGEAIALQYQAIQQWFASGGGSGHLLKKMKAPALVVCGPEDKVVPPENSSILAGLIPNSRLVCIEKSGHGLMYQVPERFCQEVLNFLG
jgi:pimeloyl-ACP methyl ester carboxylesterase